MPNLVGIGNSQVPTNAMLGGLAYQDSVGEINIDKIKARTSDTAKDIFVYDTRKDSDGGAWRHRTQNTSWYNERVSKTRGARREFPAVAVIVVEASQVTIYDGDDPNFPMWMVFNQSMTGLGAMVGYTTFTIGSCTMLNGVLMVGMDASNQANVAGLRIINFISERFDWKANIAGRNSNQTWPIIDRNTGRNNENNDGQLIVNEVIKDVAATVLKNTPIDESTGLPNPTIAIATAGGTNVIRHDRTVVQGYQTIATEHVDLHPDGYMIDGISGATNDSFSLYEIDETDRVTSYGHRADIHPINTFLNHGTGEITFEGDKNKLAIASNMGLLRIEEEFSDYASGLHNRTTSSFNTGWMIGDIKGAYLSSVDNTDISSPELLANPGNSFSNTNNWYLDASNKDTGTIATLTVSSGRLVFTHSDTNAYWDGFGTSFTCTVGEAYVVVAYIHSATNMNLLRISNTASQHDDDIQVAGSNVAGWHTHTFTATATTMYLHWNGYTDTSAMQLNVVEVRLAAEDRSVRAKGLQVRGSINRTPVAPGAELVGYSGFTASNYMKLDTVNMGFGTGDFSVSVWCLPSGDATNEFILELNNHGSNRFYLLVTADGNDKKIYVPWDSSVAGSELIDGEWNHVVVGRKTGYGFVYVNGHYIPDGHDAYTTNLAASTTGMGSVGQYGAGPTANYAWSGSLALLRISAAVPSPEQVKKMYEDEKKLFYDNAKCTFHGTSDSVTALTHDDTTNVLHVGTSSGRSEFRGLNRINNTTTAVTTAISASDEFVAEQ